MNRLVHLRARGDEPNYYCGIKATMGTIFHYDWESAAELSSNVTCPQCRSVGKLSESSVGHTFFDLSTYQAKSRATWQLVHTNHPIVYPTLGLANEAGELAGKIKKIFRDKNGVIGDEDREALKQELGDVAWYWTQICTELNLTIEEVLEANIEKLASRQERGVIGGDGDER